MQNTKIEWTDATWNPVRGCSRVSDGCRNCYAETIAKRFGGPNQPYEGLLAKGGQWNGNVSLIQSQLETPFRWRRPRRVFVNSTSDLFHENVPDWFIDRVFAVMLVCPHHQFQILTKRPQRMQLYLADRNIGSRIYQQLDTFLRNVPMTFTWPLPNVWLGTSIEDQATAEERIPHLLATPAAVRFISAEPLLGPVELQRSRHFLRCAHGHKGTARATYGCNPVLDWVIVGGESGPNARPMHPDWARSLRDQCTAAAAPFFFKQWGEWIPYEPDAQPPFFNSQHGDQIDGHQLPDADDHGPEWDMDGGADWIFRRVGKKKAGRILDGRTWDEYPETQA